MQQKHRESIRSHLDPTTVFWHQSYQQVAIHSHFHQSNSIIFNLIQFKTTTRLGKKLCDTCEKVNFYTLIYLKTITITLQNKIHRFQQSFAIDLQASEFD